MSAAFSRALAKMALAKPTLYHIPVCPFSQRLEVLLALKGMPDAVSFSCVDITKPRADELLQLTKKADGKVTTSLPVLVLADGRVLKESLVIMQYFEDALPNPVARSDPYERAIERLMITREGPFTMAGYMMVMNRKPEATAGLRDKLLEHYEWLNGFLLTHNPEGTFLFDRFGLAEAVYTPMFVRFHFLDYYEGFELPKDGRFDRVAKWREACMAHPAAQQVTSEEVVKLYADYAVGSGNGSLPAGRTVSSFTFEPHWKARPMPPKDKYERIPTDEELGLTGGKAAEAAASFPSPRA